MVNNKEISDQIHELKIILHEIHEGVMPLSESFQELL